MNSPNLKLAMLFPSAGDEPMLGRLPRFGFAQMASFALGSKIPTESKIKKKNERVVFEKLERKALLFMAHEVPKVGLNMFSN